MSSCGLFFLASDMNHGNFASYTFFFSYPGLNIQPLHPDNLTCLSSLKQIDGFLAVVNIPLISNLTFLSRLRRVQGTYPLFRGVYSVYISGNTELTALGLASLAEINYGSVVVRKNSMLCSNAVWSSLLRNPSAGVPAVLVQDTVSPQACCKLKRKAGFPWLPDLQLLLLASLNFMGQSIAFQVHSTVHILVCN